MNNLRNFIIKNDPTSRSEQASRALMLLSLEYLIAGSKIKKQALLYFPNKFLDSRVLSWRFHLKEL
jgi:hypothetical protein